MIQSVNKRCNIISNTLIAEDIYDMWLEAEDIARAARPGQFVSLFSSDGSRLLPRPISICEIDRYNGRLRLVYRIQGKGTREFSLLKPKDTVLLMGPLGNGFRREGTKALIIGGGIGIPPLLELTKNLTCEKEIILGYRGDPFLHKEFQAYGRVYLSTEDGSMGIKGNVLTAIKENKLTGDIIYACGPTPMLKGIKAYSEEHKIKAQLSLEERMACGIGACLGCVCKTAATDHHSNVKNRRICKDGPVFYADEVIL